VTIEITAPAKINLFLHVTGKKENGYHLLSSLVVFSDNIHDIIRIKEADSFSFTCSDPHLETNDNLVVKAAYALGKALNKELNCHIHLEKNLPTAAGLGGGSSDAAATIKALLQFWHVDAPEDLGNILLSLGADVPVCYYDKPCIMRGIGEIIEPLPYSLPDFDIAIMPQNTTLSTQAVFKEFKPPYGPDIKASDLPEWHSKKDLIKWLKQNSRNDLQPIALTMRPDLKDVIEQREENNTLTRLSGSGPTFFVLS
jgi:4-diphosphocytidyl-2-C-methyl-D-erythritol kinase